jgi:hypothetical protein
VLHNPKRNKPQTVLLRILTNYFQAIMIVQDFDLSWPRQVNEALQVFSIVSSSQQMFISIDCFITKSEFPIITDYIPAIYLKVIFFGILPIVCGMIAAIIWFIIHLVYLRLTGLQTQLKMNIQVTVFIILFIAYPIITTMCFSLFNCFKIDDNKSYLRRDFS